MTWIVGTNSPFGHAVLSSDIYVTFTEKLTGKKNYKDCVQKVYPLGRFIVGGFSGSIRIGFEIINFLNADLAKIADNEGWILDAVSNTWFPEELNEFFLDLRKLSATQAVQFFWQLLTLPKSKLTSTNLLHLIFYQ